ncbi:MAG: Tat pathway signal protein [Cyanobacteria bacterium REEB67]|nr:Tat pathway signal protein [Cyanobacteria bacterium REEB67]
MSDKVKLNSARDATLRIEDVLMLERVQRAHFQFFVDNQGAETGLILDRSRPDAPATIAGVGFALPAYAIAAQRQWISHAEAVAYTLKVLTVLSRVPQGDAPSGTSGFHGYFYHFLDPKTGERATSPKFWNSELSSIDTALLMGGVTFAATYYASGQSADEKQIVKLARMLYERVEWDWLLRDAPAANGDKKAQLIGHGWTPENGMITNVYNGYSEALLLYLLAIGSPTHAVPAATWDAFMSNSGRSQLATYRDETYIAMPGTPLFCYQYPHCFVDFRGIRDSLGRAVGFDYHENARRATLAQFNYAQENPRGFRAYGGFDWGLTACDGPGDKVIVVDGVERKFNWYMERGAPFGADDGTIAPTAAISSLPYAPHLVLPTIRHWLADRPELFSMHGFTDAFNPTFDHSSPSGWVDGERVSIDQGPVILMIENYRSDFCWQAMHDNVYLRRGLRLAGFKGGWLQSKRGAAGTVSRLSFKTRRRTLARAS